MVCSECAADSLNFYLLKYEIVLRHFLDVCLTMPEIEIIAI
ncbi:hypothetical protein [Sporosarcina sp. P12(2017)]|nr:hypothetical protein [Sporosarcina sp. P12(2017)]